MDETRTQLGRAGRRSGHLALNRGGRHAPRLWPVFLAAIAAVLSAGAFAWITFQWLSAVSAPAPSRPGNTSHADVLELVKTTLAISAFVGAVLTGVYAYRKQRLAEGDAQRADEAQFATRYVTAAEQLGHESAAVRLAGVYAMAHLADDWSDQRQTCIDVLCAYLRIPYEIDVSSSHYRIGEREVRRSLIRTIRNHLRSGYSAVIWTGYNFSFEGAVFDCGDLSRAQLTGGHVSFHGAKFVSGTFQFDHVTFSGAHLWFTGTEFAGARVSFRGADFAGGAVSFKGARFAGGKVIFEDARLSGCRVSLEGAAVEGAVVQWGPFSPPGAEE
jgi:Pentapeptide repeats (9 copies)